MNSLRDILLNRTSTKEEETPKEYISNMVKEVKIEEDEEEVEDGMDEGEVLFI